MALTSTVLRSSSACSFIGRVSQFYCRYLASAANRSHVIIPTSISSVRRFSSPSERSSNSKKYSDDHIPQLILDEALVGDIMSGLNSIKAELQSLRINSIKDGLEILTKAKEVVKEKDPFIKEIELEMSKAETTRQTQQLPIGFEIVRDNNTVINLKGKYKDEIIGIEVYRPHNAFSANFKMAIIITVTSQELGFFDRSKADFHCIATKNRYVIDKIWSRSDDGYSQGVVFGELPENLQRESYNYLEKRGVSFTTTDILYEYMLNKIHRGNLRGLEPFTNIIDAKYLL